MATTRISVTVDDADLKCLRRRAKQLFGGNLSAVVAETAAWIRRQDALNRLLDREGLPPLTATQIAEILAEWQKPARPAKRSRKKRAA